MQYLQNLGHWSQLGQVRQLPKLFLQSTVNTWVTCSTCRGFGVKSVPHQNGQVDLILCPHCKGKKKYFNGVN